MWVLGVLLTKPPLTSCPSPSTRELEREESREDRRRELKGPRKGVEKRVRRPVGKTK
ncbi:hypothetical protein GCM10007116_13270 [Sulfodiicoccus acidiphilus]|uniref:Uncharacterized protein n=1 Tax=Sulfodiicoccus acidiphilus TaxID=1670455 RepID=A0A830GZI4_9CREN|nr:hypothetical protein GCM10007116_13270 [Sulfodiicoccus acidiphilus]